jgi:hypothetical protein
MAQESQDDLDTASGVRVDSSETHNLLSQQETSRNLVLRNDKLLASNINS